MPSKATYHTIQSTKPPLITPQATRTTMQPPTPTRDYFSSPITTLSRSVTSPQNISRIDTLEAYLSFCDKLQEEYDQVADDKRGHKMLKLLRNNSATVHVAINRDLKLFMTKSNWDASLGRQDAIMVLSEHLALPLAAARFFGQVARLQPLYTQFPKSHLQTLITTVTDVLLADDLPEAGLARTWQALVFLLGSQRLSFSCSLPWSSRIVDSLCKGFVAMENENVRIESLKAVRSLLNEDPVQFVPPFFRILHNIFPLLMHSSDNLRREAGRTVVTLASIKLAHLDQLCKHYNKLAGFVCDFVNDHSGSAARKSPSGTLVDALALSRWGASESPFWTIPLLTALIILSDHGALTHSISLKIFGKHASGLTRHETVAQLQYPMHHCLVYAYSRVLSAPSQSRPSPSQATQEKSDQSLLFVSQDLRGGTGEAVLAILLRRGSCLTESLALLKRMVNNGDRDVQTDGVELLANLVARIGCTVPAVPDNYPTPEEYVNRGLLGEPLFLATKASIISVIEDMKLNARPGFSWQLSNGDLKKHCGTLWELWTDAVQAYIGSQNSEVSATLVQIWKALVMIQRETDQSSTGARLRSRVTSGLARVFADSKSWDQDTQRMILPFVGRLWGTLKNLVPPSHFEQPSATLLASLCDAGFNVGVETIGTEWTKLGVELLPAATVNLIKPFATVLPKSLKLSRIFWPLVARACRADEASSLEDLMTFLQVSFGYWMLSTNELQLWGHYASRAGALTGDPSHLVRTVLDSERSSKYCGPTQCLTFINAIPSIKLEDISNKSLLLLDNALVEMYPTRVSEEISPCVHEFLHRVGESMSTSAAFARLSTGLKTGLGKWLLDSAELFSVDEHTLLVDKLFCDPLDRLKRNHEPSLAFLIQIAPYCKIALESSRSVTPLGALAMRRFWEDNYEGVLPQSDVGDTGMEACLGVCRDVALLIGKSQESDSSIVPDSCSPTAGRPLRMFSSPPQSLSQRLVTPTTGPRTCEHGPSAGLSDTPSRLPKRPSPSLAEGSQAKKMKLSLSLEASPLRETKKVVFEGVIIPSSAQRRSQLKTPCPSEASAPANGALNSSQDLLESDDDGQAVIGYDVEETKDDHEEPTQYPLEQSQAQDLDEDEHPQWKQQSQPRDFDLYDDENIVIDSHVQENPEDEEDTDVDHVKQGRESSLIFSSPSPHANRSHTETTPRDSPPTLQRAQAISIPCIPAALSALQDAASSVNVPTMTTDQLIEIQRIALRLNSKIIDEIAKRLSG